jgi:hypothetical protein
MARLGTIEKRSLIGEAISREIVAGGYEPRADWTLSQGTIRCGEPGEAYWHFEVLLTNPMDGWTTVGITRIDDKVRDGVPRDRRKGDRIEERSFDIADLGSLPMERMLRALRTEIAIWVDARQAAKEREWDEIHGPAQAVASIAEKLQELVDRDPQGAGEAIAGLLGKKFDKDEITALQAVVEEANAEAFSPR